MFMARSGWLPANAILRSIEPTGYYLPDTHMTDARHYREAFGFICRHFILLDVVYKFFYSQTGLLPPRTSFRPANGCLHRILH